MDSLLSAYSTGLDEEDNQKPEFGPARPDFSPTKQPKPDYSYPKSRKTPVSSLHAEAPLAGRYISKRERAAMVSDSNPPSHVLHSSPVMGTFSEVGLPYTVLSKLRHQTKGSEQLGKLPEEMPKFSRNYMALMEIMNLFWNANEWLC